jgi:hypothetical protein
MDLLERLVDEEIDRIYQVRRAKRKRRDWFSMSNAGFCMRATVLNRLNAKEKDHTPKQKRIFWIGQIIHDAVEALLKKSGRLVSSEEFVGSKFEPGCDQIGAIDFILKEDDNSQSLYEFKSKNTGSFWSSIIRKGQAATNNIYQGVTYFLKIKKHRVDALKIAYWSKEDAAMATFKIDTGAFKQQVNDWWDVVRTYFNLEELPPTYKETDKEFEWFCNSKTGPCTFKDNYCPFSDNTGYHEEISNNIKGLVWNEEQEKKTERNNTINKILETEKPT